jgi:hypothetical protein
MGSRRTDNCSTSRTALAAGAENVPDEYQRTATDRHPKEFMAARSMSLFQVGGILSNPIHPVAFTSLLFVHDDLERHLPVRAMR